MQDEYTNTMRKHHGNCFQSFGFSQSGADQLARQEQVSDPVDQAMMKAYQQTNDPMNTKLYDKNLSKKIIKVSKFDRNIEESKVIETQPSRTKELPLE